jgi:hypothetical protein
MPAIDRVNRRGINTSSVLLGPARLGKLRPSDAGGNVGRQFRLAAPSDQFEITTNGAGISDVAYTLVVRPYSEANLPPSTSPLGKVALIRQVDGRNTPSAGLSCLALRPHASTSSTTRLGPFTVNAADRLWAVIEDRGYSTVKYQIELVADFITIGTQPANASVTAPAAANFTVAATTNDGGSLSYQWQISTDGGTSYSNVSNGGVYSGATTVTLAISNSTGLNTRRYRCLVTSTLTAPVATSNGALLTVA